MEATVYAVEDPADLDVEKAAFELMPRLTGTDNTVLRREYASALADLMTGTAGFSRYVNGNTGDLAERRARLLDIFRDNVRLLVAKTWVDDHDEQRKSETLDLLDSFVGMMDARDHIHAIPAFASLADAIACLLFGEDSRSYGFMEYVFRIDPRLGIFYWYTAQLRLQCSPAHGVTIDDELAHLELLIGIFALSSF